MVQRVLALSDPQPTTRLMLALVAACVVTALLLLIMIALLQRPATNRPTLIEGAPALMLRRRDSTSADAATRPRLVPPSRSPVASVRWRAPALDGASLKLDPSPTATLAIELPRVEVQAPWSENARQEVDWQGQLRQQAERAVGTAAPGQFNESRRDRFNAPAIDFAPSPRRERGGLPESYKNTYGEIEIQVTEDCVARENRSMADLDWIDVLPPIIHCKPPASTFALPPHLIKRRRPTAPH